MDKDISKRLGPHPNNDYGSVRERRDFQPLQVGLKPILPCPFRDVSFTELTGFRYHPTANKEDRLGSSRGFQEKITKEMIIPPSWIDNEQVPEERTTRRPEDVHENDPLIVKRQKLQELLNVKRQKLQELSSSATIVTNSTGDSSAATLVTNSTASLPQQPKDWISMGNQPRIAAKANSDPPVVPKAALYVFYGKKPRRVQLSGNAYITWDNGSKTHELKYTSIFICPITKECFIAGHYGDSYFHDPNNNLVWYSKKMLAEHAVAARTLDCWNLREQIPDGDRIGLDEPYWPTQKPNLPFDLFPSQVQEALQKALDFTPSTTSSTTPPPSSRTLAPPASQKPADPRLKGQGSNNYPSGLPPQNWTRPTPQALPPPPPPPRTPPWQTNQQEYIQQRRTGGATSDAPIPDYAAYDSGYGKNSSEDAVQYYDYNSTTNNIGQPADGTNTNNSAGYADHGDGSRGNKSGYSVEW